MKHTHFKELLCLSLYDELNGEEERLLREHLAGCDDCRLAMSEMKSVHSLMGRTSFDVSDELLSEARTQAHAALVHLRKKRSAADAVLEFIRDSIVPRYRTAFAGIAMAAAGLFIGYLVFSPANEHRLSDAAGGAAAPAQRSADTGRYAEAAGVSSADADGSFADDGSGRTGASSSFMKGDVRTTNIRILRADARTGAVEFLFDAVSPVFVSGNVHDENVQKILVRTLKDEDNPGVRLQAVGMIMSNTEAHPAADPRMKTALIAALKKDDNPAVRRAVLDVLRLYPQDKDIQRALAYVLLNDKNSGVRIAAINALAAGRLDGHDLDESVRAVLKRKIQYDKNAFIRNQSRNVLQEESQS